MLRTWLALGSVMAGAELKESKTSLLAEEGRALNLSGRIADS